jgi:hypothetical protein
MEEEETVARGELNGRQWADCNCIIRRNKLAAIPPLDGQFDSRIALSSSKRSQYAWRAL